MEILNNLSIIISIIVGIFGIGGYIVGISSYLRNKVASSQRKQTSQFQSFQKQSPYHIATRPLSKLDWMQILWQGIEDFCEAYFARGGAGCGITFMFFFFGSIIVTIAWPFINLPAVYIPLAILFVLFITVHLLFYTYFVGRRIEKKIENLSQPLTQKARNRSSY